MKVLKKSAGDNTVRLDVTASTQEVSEALNQSAIQFCNQMGLRPVRGKTPAEVASAQLGIKDLDSVVADQAIERLVPLAISKHNVMPAFQPQVQADSPLKRGRTFQFHMDVTPKPQYELPDYGPVSITIDAYTSDEQEVDRQISQMAQQYTTYVADEAHPIHAGDDVKISIRATHNGEPFEGLNTDGRTYQLGRGYMPEDFDAALEGMEVGEERTFTFKGPELGENDEVVYEDYEATVKLLEVQKEVVPVIDDEWVKKNMPMFGTLEELRRGIGMENDKERRKYYEDYKRNVAATKLAERFEGSIPDELYEGTARELQRNLRQQVASSGMKWEDFCEQQGGQQQVNMMMMLQTRQQLVQGFALDAYYRHHKLSYTEEDLDEACFQLNPQNPHAARSQMESNGLGYALREAAERLRACKHLVETADITVKEAPQE